MFRKIEVNERFGVFKANTGLQRGERLDEECCLIPGTERTAPIMPLVCALVDNVVVSRGELLSSSLFVRGSFAACPGPHSRSKRKRNGARRSRENKNPAIGHRGFAGCVESPWTLVGTKEAHNINQRRFFLLLLLFMHIGEPSS